MKRGLIFGGVILVLMIGTAVYDIDHGAVDTSSWETFKQTFGTFVAAWLTFCILSFLYKDNPFYRAAEHVMVGLAMGYFAVYYTFEVLKPRFWNPLIYGTDLNPEDILFGSQLTFRMALIIPAILGILMLTRISQKWGWLSRWSIATTIGIGSGLAIPLTIQARVLTQVQSGSELAINYIPALRRGSEFLAGYDDISVWQVGAPILMIASICTLVYFFFSVPHRGVIGHTARVGILALMVGFGASFGYTVMARLSLFIGRVLFLLKDWLDILPRT